MLRKLFAALALLIASVTPAFADSVTGVISNIYVSYGGNYDLRITFAGSPLMCSANATFAYLNASDTNYSSFASQLTLAKVTGGTVSLTTSAVGGQCKIIEASIN